MNSLRKVLGGFVMKTVSFALVALAFATPSYASDTKHYPDAKESYPFVLKVQDFYGAEGFGFDYYLDKSKLVVVWWDDFGSPRKEILSKVLTKDEARDWALYLKRFPIAQLKEDYSNPGVSDGVQQVFTFRIDGKEKKVTLRNIRVEELEKLCQKLNLLIPERGMRLRAVTHLDFP